MKFKEEKEDKNLSSILTKMVQIEADKLSLVEAALSYFYIKGNMEYCKFFEKLHDMFSKCRLDTTRFVYLTCGKMPEYTIAELSLEFEKDESVFELLASMENDYIDNLEKALDASYNASDWESVSYLLDKLEKVRARICNRALAGVKNKCNISQLIPCEQHS